MARMNDLVEYVRERWWQDRPGTSSRSLIERDARAFFHQANSTPVDFTIRHVDGVWAEDMDGHRFMDFQGNSCHNIGYRHPRLVAALRDQVDRLPFVPRRFTSEEAVTLAEKLIDIWPYGQARVLIGLSGSDSIEMALKHAYVATGRKTTLAFEQSWHGAGLGAVSVGGRAWEREGYPLLEGCHHVSAYWRPIDGQPATKEAVTEGARGSLHQIRKKFEAHGGFAAFISEPIETTPHVAPEWFWPEVRQLCNDYDTLLIFDEIPGGLGKTGRFFASEHLDVAPDITVLGKSLGGGALAVSAMVGHESLNVVNHLAAGHYTHQKNPLMSRAALETICIIEQEGLVGRAARLGRKTLEALTEVADSSPLIAEARGIGLLMALEIDAVEHSASEVAQILSATQIEAMRQGLNIGVSDGRFLCLAPPLNISEDDLGLAVSIVKGTVEQVGTDLGSR